jgi:acyl-ACP thioesterase
MIVENIYTKEFTLSDLHTDCFGRLKPAVMLWLIQEVSGTHASHLGASWDALAQKNLFWAVIRHKVEIFRLPEVGQTVTLRTWPMPTTRVAYPRATEARDAEGNLLFRSHAIWVLMDSNTRAMVLPGKSGVDVPGTLLGCEAAAPGSIHGRTLENYVNRTVGYAVLDKNGHMNNTRWLDWTSNLLSSQFHRDHTLKQLDICYLAEATEGQQLSLFWQLDEENQLQVEALTADGSARRILALNAQYEDFVRV